MYKSIVLILTAVIFLTSCSSKKDISQKSYTKVYKKPVIKKIKSYQVFYAKDGLMWQDNVDAKRKRVTWSEANSYCNNLYLGGFTDWRVPNIVELNTLVDLSKSGPAIISGVKNTTSSSYWSSTEVAYNKAKIVSVGFYDGVEYWNKKVDKFYVRCVRGNTDTKKDKDFNSIVETLVKIELNNIKKPKEKITLIKGEFETTAEFEERVKRTEEKNKTDKEKYEKEIASKQYIARKRAITKALEITWGKPEIKNIKYDADNGYFIGDLSFEIKKDFNKRVAIKVDRSNARDFKKRFSKLKPTALFSYDIDSVSLKDIYIPYNSNDYFVEFTNIDPNDTKLAVNISNSYNLPTSTNISIDRNRVKNFDVSKLVDLKAIDKLLSKTTQAKIDNKKWLFVIGIEQYEFTDNINFAKRSAISFKNVMSKVKGITPENSFVMINSGATQAKIKTNLKKMLKRVKDGDTIYFYYNGHGLPVPSLGFEPFILTSDSEPDYVKDEEFFSLKNIYGELSSSKASKVVAVIDSCFSGVTDGVGILKGVAATKMKSKKVNFDKEKMVILSAGKSHQYSNGYEKKGHRLFSYYIMENILEGKTDIKSLYKETKLETYETSLKEYGDIRVQEPTLEGNFRLEL